MSTKTEKILITDFIKKYNALASATTKEGYLKSIIKRTYCPVLEKKVILEMMAEKSANEDGIKYIDLFTNRINFIATIISLYTTLVPEKTEDNKPKTFEMYDLLVENDILNKILELIGEREITELTNINGVILDNWHMKHSSTEAYIANLVDSVSQKIGITAGAGMDKLADVLSDEVKMGKVMGAIDKIYKKIK